MVKASHPLTLPLLLAATLLVSGCEYKRNVHGNVFRAEEVNLIQRGETNREQVRGLLGSPTFVHSLGKERWIYVTDTRFKGSRAVNRVEITFNAMGVVDDVQKNFQEDLLQPETVRDQQIEQEGYLKALWPVQEEFGPINTLGVDGAPRQTRPERVRHPSETMSDEERPWWMKVLLIRPGYKDPSKPTTEPPPDITFSPEEKGWWQNLWTSDPAGGASGATDGAAPVVEEEPKPVEKKGGLGAIWPFGKSSPEKQETPEASPQVTPLPEESPPPEEPPLPRAETPPRPASPPPAVAAEPQEAPQAPAAQSLKRGRSWFEGLFGGGDPPAGP